MGDSEKYHTPNSMSMYGKYNSSALPSSGMLMTIGNKDKRLTQMYSPDGQAISLFRQYKDGTFTDWDFTDGATLRQSMLGGSAMDFYCMLGIRTVDCFEYEDLSNLCDDFRYRVYNYIGGVYLYLSFTKNNEDSKDTEYKVGGFIEVPDGIKGKRRLMFSGDDIDDGASQLPVPLMNYDKESPAIPCGIDSNGDPLYFIIKREDADNSYSSQYYQYHLTVYLYSKNGLHSNETYTLGCHVPYVNSIGTFKTYNQFPDNNMFTKIGAHYYYPNALIN